MINSYMPYRWTVILALFIFVFMAVLIKGKDVKREERLDKVSLGNISQRISNFHIFRLNGEDIEMEIKADNAVVYSGEEDTSIHGIEITYNPHRSRPIKMYADKGRYNNSQNILFVEKEANDVDIKIGSNVTIKAKSFQWLEDKKELHSSGKVFVNGDNFSLEGEGLVADINNGVYELKKNIKAAMW